MRYRYLDNFRRGISVFAIFSYGFAVLGFPSVPLAQAVETSVTVNNSPIQDYVHQKIKLNLLLKWFLGSNLSQKLITLRI